MEQHVVPLIYILCLWLFNFIGITVLITVIIHLHNKKDEEKHKTAAAERRTIIDRIERLQRQIEQYEGRAYFMFNHTRYDIVEKCPGLVKKDGTVKHTGEFHIDSKHVGEEVITLVMLSGGELARAFGAE